MSIIRPLFHLWSFSSIQLKDICLLVMQISCIELKDILLLVMQNHVWLTYIIIKVLYMIYLNSEKVLISKNCFIFCRKKFYSFSRDRYLNFMLYIFVYFYFFIKFLKFFIQKYKSIRKLLFFQSLNIYKILNILFF